MRVSERHGEEGKAVLTHGPEGSVFHRGEGAAVGPAPVHSGGRLLTHSFAGREGKQGVRLDSAHVLFSFYSWAPALGMGLATFLPSWYSLETPSETQFVDGMSHHRYSGSINRQVATERSPLRASHPSWIHGIYSLEKGQVQGEHGSL